MFSRTNRNRIKIPNGVAALAAIVVMLGIIAHPDQLKLAENQHALAEQTKDSTVDESVSELVGVAVSAAKPVKLNISSLIFRF